MIPSDGRNTVKSNTTCLPLLRDITSWLSQLEHWLHAALYKIFYFIFKMYCSRTKNLCSYCTNVQESKYFMLINRIPRHSVHLINLWKVFTSLQFHTARLLFFLHKKEGHKYSTLIFRTDKNSYFKMPKTIHAAWLTYKPWQNITHQSLVYRWSLALTFWHTDLDLTRLCH